MNRFSSRDYSQFKVTDIIKNKRFGIGFSYAFTHRANPRILAHKDQCFLGAFTCIMCSRIFETKIKVIMYEVP